MKAKSLAAVLLLGVLFVTANESYACGPPPDRNPVANLVADPEYLLTDGNVILDGSGSYDPDPGDSITKYEWDFDYDGNFTPDYNETPGDGIATHPYSSPGTHTVMLRVTDENSNTGTDTCTVHVRQTYYVDPNGNDDNNGLSWATAFATIQRGIDETNHYDIVEVNEGIYYETIDFNGIWCTVTSIDPNDPYVVAATVIDGNSDDVNSVVTFDQSEDYAVLNGFKITNGAKGGIYCDGASPTINNCLIIDNNTGDYGGGMYIKDSSPTVTDCFFVGNDANYGGGICNTNSSPRVINCVFSGNTADVNGGGMYNDNSSVIVTNCTFSNNSAADYGGGICNYKSALIMTNCIIWDNDANTGDSIYNYDVNYPDDSNLVGWWKLDETDGNTANDSAGNNDGTLINGPTWVSGKVGGALDLDGVDGYVEVPDDDSLNPTNAITIAFWIYNRGGQDAGIYKYASCPGEPASPGPSRAYDIAISSSTGEIYFEIFVDEGTYDRIVSNSTVPLNEWHHVAGTFDQGQAAVYIDGVLDKSMTMTMLVTSIMNDDHSLIIGGLWDYCGVDNFIQRFNGKVDGLRIYNRALSEDEIRALWGYISYSDIEGCGGSGSWDPNFGADGGGNIDSDPCFVDPCTLPGDDGVFGTLDDGLELAAGSPCIDAANNDAISEANDIAGNSRKLDDPCATDTGNGTAPIVDMGAYEYDWRRIFVDVDATGNGDGSSWADAYNKIQDAIDAAVDGQIVFVAEGTYYENISFKGKAITVTSTNTSDPSVTVIDGSNNKTVTFGNSENPNSVLKGFTITTTGVIPSGIYCEGASPTITNCIISNNGGTGVRCYSSSSPTITNCTISGNDNSSTGVYCNSSSPTITNCTISGYFGDGVFCYNSSSPAITNCAITNNGDGVSCYSSSSPTITNCTLSSNSSYGVYNSSYSSSPTITNSILWNNNDDLYNCSATFSCVENHDPGSGNFSINPRFVNADANNFHLLSWSRCIDSGDPSSDYSNEPNGGGGRINMGRYGNTAEATTASADLDQDGLPDAWQEYYWQGYDPNDPNYGPDGNPDVDDFNNWVEYLFGYNPNEVNEGQAMDLIVTLSTTQIDPTAGDELTISYISNMDANDVNVSSAHTDTAKVVWKISQTATAGTTNQVVWDGRDNNDVIVERYFYDITIDANAGDGNTVSWTSPDEGNTSHSGPYLYDVNANDFDPYKNIPVIIKCKINTWVTRDIDIVKDECESCRIYRVSDNRLLKPGWNTFYWYGRWDVDPNTGQICKEVFDVYFEVPGNVNKGAVLVYYDEVLSNLRCNPYRILPLSDEITTISYDLACDANVTIDIYDPDGSFFGTMFKEQTAGPQQVIWYGTDGDPNDPNSRYISTEGTYRIELECDKSGEKLEGSITAYK